MDDTSSTTEICGSPKHTQWVNTAGAFIPARSDGREDRKTHYRKFSVYLCKCRNLTRTHFPTNLDGSLNKTNIFSSLFADK